MTTHNLTCRIIDNHLQQAVGLVHGDCLAVTAEECFLDRHVKTTLGTLLLGQSHHRQLGHGEHSTGHNVELDVVGLAHDGMQGTLSLSTSGMGEHHATVHITDGIHTRHVGHHVVINLDATAANSNAYSVKTLRQDRLATYRHEHLLGSNALGLTLELIGHGHAVLALGDAVHGSTGDDLDASLAQDGL